MKPHRSCVVSTIRASAAASLAAALPCVAGAAETNLAGLEQRVQQQQAVIEKQQRQIEAQDARLREQEQLLRQLAARAGIPVEAAGTSAAAAAVPVTPAAAEVAAPPTAAPVGTRYGGIDVTLFGALRTTVTTTTARMQPDATPFLVLPPLPGAADGTTKIDARLSSLALSIKGYTLGQFQLAGTIYAYLFDGDLFSGKYGVYPGMAYIDATSDDWRFALGLQQDVYAPMMPGMVDRMSAFAGSGNVGNSFKPQLRVERYLATAGGRVTLQGAIADPLPSNIKPGFTDSTESAGVPNVEARIVWEHGDDDTAWLKWPRYTLGVSGAAGRFRTLYDADPAPDTQRIRSYETNLSGLALEAGWRIGDRIGIQGEIYDGRALGPYLGTVFQTVNSVTREALASSGAWGEVAWYWTPQHHSHVGYGIDRVDAEGHPTIRSNETAFANFFWDPSAMTTLAIEATWRRTEYLGGVDNDGFALMLSSELRF